MGITIAERRIVVLVKQLDIVHQRPALKALTSCNLSRDRQDLSESTVDHVSLNA